MGNGGSDWIAVYGVPSTRDFYKKCHEAFVELGRKGLVGRIVTNSEGKGYVSLKKRDEDGSFGFYFGEDDVLWRSVGMLLNHDYNEVFIMKAPVLSSEGLGPSRLLLESLRVPGKIECLEYTLGSVEEISTEKEKGLKSLAREKGSFSPGKFYRESFFGSLYIGSKKKRKGIKENPLKKKDLPGWDDDVFSSSPKNQKKIFSTKKSKDTKRESKPSKNKKRRLFGRGF
ncbi:hypothetical protein B6U91_01125 [Candidatus Pacearchaeota archaeon ex4484_71]|nr:MAG: hypothetical protein B6U91_01125 [Candidatus Pacearchaeota archaeon ex4484_71]